MFAFLKKLFGGDADTNREAGVQIEQVPYKVEPAVEKVTAEPVVSKVEIANAQPIVKDSVPDAKSSTKTVAKPKAPAKPKSTAAKPKSAAKITGKKTTNKRKPKASA